VPIARETGPGSRANKRFAGSRYVAERPEPEPPRPEAPLCLTCCAVAVLRQESAAASAWQWSVCHKPACVTLAELIAEAGRAIGERCCGSP
jgi:hypothetical protein